MKSKCQFALALFFILVIFVLFVNEEAFFWFHSLVSGSAYQYAVLFGVGFLVFALFFKYVFFDLLAKKRVEQLVNLFFHLLFAPVAFLPLVSCFFKLPFIFCHVCPRKCVWGTLRRFIIPGAVFVNFDARRWCFLACPVGSAQDAAKDFVKKAKKTYELPKAFGVTRCVVLFAIIFLYVYFLIRHDPFSLYDSPDFLSSFFFSFVYASFLPVFLLSLIFFGVSFFVPRFFCNYFCPLGVIGDIILKLKKKVTTTK